MIAIVWLGVQAEAQTPCQQQLDPRAGHDTPANILNAAARVPGAPAHLSVQSAFPSSASPALFVIVMAALHPKPR